MRVLVTGGAGFIGGHLVEELLRMKYEVIVVDDQSATSSEKFNWFEKAENYNFSILDKEKMDSLFEKKIDYVFHLAAETKIQLSIENPEKCFNTNIMGTINLLELCRKHSVKRVVIASSSSVYGLNSIPNIETQYPNCLNPYAASKMCDEILAQTYYNIFKLQTLCFRFFNVYGERMPEKGAYAPVIAIFNKQLRNKEAMTITGDGSQERDFIHVSDVVQGLILGMLTDNEKCFGNFYNLGSGTNLSILEIAKNMGDNYIFIPHRHGDAKSTLADISKTKLDLNWEPRVVLADWIKQYTNRNNNENR
jgi:UDP-glucose 4-epimerase